MDWMTYRRLDIAADKAEEAREAVMDLDTEVQELRAQVRDLANLLEAFLVVQVRTGAILEKDLREALSDVKKLRVAVPTTPGVRICPECNRPSPLDRPACMYCGKPLETGGEDAGELP